jgi:hypothetical protein
MDENPYSAPREKPLHRPEVNASSQRRYESLGQRFLSAVLLVLTGPLWVAVVLAILSASGKLAVANTIVSGAIMLWTASCVWVIVRVIRRIRSK